MANSQATNSWLLNYKSNPRVLLRLFCFPYAGGGANIYRSWAAGVPVNVDVCPVEFPGRGSRLREPPFTRITRLVEALVESLSSYFDRPFVFFGHSMGAIIGFELARLLRKEGREGPTHLFVSGCRAPQWPRKISSTYDLPEAEFLAELRRLNGTPKEVFEHEELLQLTMPLLRADFEMVDTYRYSAESPLDCPITAYGGLQDIEVAREQFEGWREQTTGRFLLRMLPGDHFFLHAAQPLLLRTLSIDVQQAIDAMSEKGP